MRALVAAVAAGAASATVSVIASRALIAHPPGGAATWNRTNHAGRTVTLLEGPAYAAGAACGAAVLGAGPGPVLATAAAAGLGALDDLAGSTSSKGFKGHLSALLRGEVTTGAVKIVGLGGSGLLAAALVDRRRGGVGVVDTLVGGAVVAGAANFVNLLDLRPGRALKATLALGVLLASAPGSEAAGAPRGASAGAAAAGAAAGAAVGLLRADLAGESMLGDTGANAAGALLGTALLQRTSRRGRVAALVVLAGLTLASEKVSFTRVIESTPVLRELDALGRR